MTSQVWQTGRTIAAARAEATRAAQERVASQTPDGTRLREVECHTGLPPPKNPRARQAARVAC